MEKQKFKFVILRILAHRLQSWSDFVLKLLGEEKRSKQHDQAKAPSVSTESAADASEELTSTASTVERIEADNPPSDWLVRTSAAEPPTHWLMRVQKDAPELLEGKGHSPRHIVPRFSSSSAVQADSGAQVTDIAGGRSTREGEFTQARRDSREWMEGDKRAREEERTPQDETEVPVTPHLMTRRDTAQRPGQGEAPVQSSEPDVHPVPSAEASPELPERKEHFPQSDVPHFLPLSAVQAGGNLPETNARTERSTREGEFTQARVDSHAWVEGDKRAREEERTPQDETEVPALSHPVLPRQTEKRVGQGREPTQPGESSLHLTFSVRGWQSPMMKLDSLAEEERAGRYSCQQDRYDLWPQASISVVACDYRSALPTKASGQPVTAMNWPSLPTKEEIDIQDWEMAWRAWKRQQRLDEEQRGNTWNG